MVGWLVGWFAGGIWEVRIVQVEQVVQALVLIRDQGKEKAGKKMGI